MKKLLVLVAGGIGYVLGTKAGRERYDQILSTFNKVKDDPRVQEKAQGHRRSQQRGRQGAILERVRQRGLVLLRPGRPPEPGEHHLPGQPRPPGRPALTGRCSDRG
jgi:hypothetical protein